MNISRNSWHYRLYTWARYHSDADFPDDDELNLCEYINLTLYYGIIRNVLLVLLVLLIGLIILFVGYDSAILEWDAWHHHLFGALVFHGCVLAGLGIFVWVVYRNNNPVDSPSLFSQWLTARKQRFCPKITVINGE